MDRIEAKAEVVRMADKAIAQLNSGNVKTGMNGPYADPETEYRSLAHWACVFEALHSICSRKEYSDALFLIRERLLAGAIESEDWAVYKCREKKGKDSVNGTIGPAWIIMGLMAISRALKDERSASLAMKIFHSLEFEKEIGCWKRREVDGRILWCDETFNHQLWFAAAGADILRSVSDAGIRQSVLSFLDHCMTSRIFSIYKDGLIAHYTCIPDQWGSLKSAKRRKLKNSLKRVVGKPNMAYKERGYHCFALFGFALIHRVLPGHPVFDTEKMRKAVEFAFSGPYLDSLVACRAEEDGTGLAQRYNLNYNIYGFAYNSPAFELPLISKELKGEHMSSDDFSLLFERQIMTTGWPIRNEDGIDAPTLESRIYELALAVIADTQAEA